MTPHPTSVSLSPCHGTQPVFMRALFSPGWLVIGSCDSPLSTGSLSIIPSYHRLCGQEQPTKPLVMEVFGPSHDRFVVAENRKKKVCQISLLEALERVGGSEARRLWSAFAGCSQHALTCAWFRWPVVFCALESHASCVCGAFGIIEGYCTVCTRNSSRLYLNRRRRGSGRVGRRETGLDPHHHHE